MRTAYLSVLFLAATGAAQTVIVPSAAQTSPPTTSQWWSLYVFWGSTTTPNASRSQLIYATSDVSATTAVWNSVSVRRPSANTQGSYVLNGNVAFTANATITLSVSPNAYTAASSTFANNTGPSPVTVLSGMISLPTRGAVPTWPAPWEVALPFSTPYVFVQAAGKSLVFDILQTGSTGTSVWYVEAQTADLGSRGENPSSGGYQPNCKFSNGSYNSGISYQYPALGRSWYVNYQGGLPSGLTAIGAIGTQGAGGTWAGLPLPIDLAPYGAPGCRWSVSADFSTPLMVVGSGNIYQWPTIPIPNDPSLAHKVFYDHALFLDPSANPWGVVTGWSSKWTIGNLIGAPAAQVYAIGGSAMNPTGTVTQELGVSLMFN